MAKTDLKDLGSSVCVDDQNEKFVPALGDGTFGVPGNLCSIDPANGRIRGSDIDANYDVGENFVGILMESKITGTETVIVQDVPCKLVVPKSGHNYRIRCQAIPAGGEHIGTGVTYSTDAGFVDAEDVTLLLTKLAHLSLPAAQSDTVIEVTWK